jgi:hypothetical protein
MKIEEAVIGTRIKTLVEFAGVPIGTEGVIAFDYGSGVMVKWDLPGDPNWPLRDGFDKEIELKCLEVVRR